MFEAPKTSEVSNKILTIPNVISFIRLCMVPVFFYELMIGNNVIACVLFALAAITDFLDGLIARSMNCVTKLGQILDPAVDRALVIFGVVGLTIVGRLPLWIVVLILLRDAVFLFGGGYILKRYSIRVPVIYLGKVVTTILFVGFAGLILYMPLIPGLGWCTFPWLPGFNADPCCWAIWLIYLGLILGAITSCYYVSQAIKKFKAVKSGQEVAWE